METFFLTLMITSIVFVLVGFLINFCRRRLAKTPHGLSGMCHQTGGEICASCAERPENANDKGDTVATAD